MRQRSGASINTLQGRTSDQTAGRTPGRPPRRSPGPCTSCGAPARRLFRVRDGAMLPFRAVCAVCAARTAHDNPAFVYGGRTNAGGPRR